MIPFKTMSASSSVIAGQALQGVFTRAGRAPAAMWNLCLAESVGVCATDAVVVALDMSTPQARRRKKVVSVSINDVGTTPTRAQLYVLADVSSQCRNRYTEMQRICCTQLCVRKVDIGDGQAAVERLSGVFPNGRLVVEPFYKIMEL
jgi:hypothetical protein